MYYQKQERLTGDRGNNAFSYEVRKSAGKEPALFVAACEEGKATDLRLGDEVVFEEMEEERLRSCMGLEKFIRITEGKKETVIFDNHNHAFYFWAEARGRGLITQDISLLHVDQHKDMRDPGVYFSQEDLGDLEKVAVYTNEVLNVGNFIVPAQKIGLVGEVALLEREEQFLQDMIIPEKFILDIDLDMFAPELAFMDQEKILERTRELYKKATFVTVATSPFFIEQELALEWFFKIIA